MSSPQLSVFTFPADGATSFTEYLGGPAGSLQTELPISAPPPPSSPPPTVPRSTPTMSSSTEPPPSLPATSVTATTEPTLPGTEPRPAHSVQSVQPVSEESHHSQPEAAAPATAALAAAPGTAGVEADPAVSPPEDSPPGASMASSFTFAGSQLSGPGSQGSAASSRHSDWEYVGGQPESAAGQETTAKLQVRRDTAADTRTGSMSEDSRRAPLDRRLLPNYR